MCYELRKGQQPDCKTWVSFVTPLRRRHGETQSSSMFFGCKPLIIKAALFRHSPPVVHGARLRFNWSLATSFECAQ
jgi:hypothetical protein